MGKILDKLDRWMLKKVLRNIDSLRGDLSVGGYPNEAYEIGEVLTKIERMEKEKLNNVDNS